MTIKEIEKKYNISVVYNHLIHFNDLNEYSVGVLAEDTIALIRQEAKEVEKLLEIEKNIKLLKEWL